MGIQGFRLNSVFFRALGVPTDKSTLFTDPLNTMVDEGFIISGEEDSFVNIPPEYGEKFAESPATAFLERLLDPFARVVRAVPTNLVEEFKQKARKFPSVLAMSATMPPVPAAIFAGMAVAGIGGAEGEVDNTEKSLSVGARPVINIPAEVMTNIKELIRTKEADKLEAYLRALDANMLWAIYAEIYDDVQNSLSVCRRLVDLHDQFAAGTDVLDIGGGTGLNTKGFVERGFNVVAVEPNANMRGIMEAKVGGAKNLKVISSFFEDADLGVEAFDTVSTRNVIYLVGDPAVFLQRAFAVTKPGGRILISSIMPSSLEALQKLKNMHQKEIEESGRTDELAWKNDLVDAISKVILKNTTIHKYTTREMVDLLRNAGYKDIVFEEDTKNLGDYFFFVAAQRPSDTAQAIPDQTYEVERGNIDGWLAFLRSVPLDTSDIVNMLEELIRKTDAILKAKGPSREAAEAFAEEGKSHLELVRTFIRATSRAIENGSGWTWTNPLLEGFAPKGPIIKGIDSAGRAYINEADILRLTGDRIGAAAARGKFGSLCLEAAEMLVKWLKAGFHVYKMAIDNEEFVYTFDGRTFPFVVGVYEMIKSTFETAEGAFDDQLNLLRDAGADESVIKEAWDLRKKAAIMHAEMFELGEDLYVRVGRGFMQGGTFTMIEALKMFSNAKVMLDQAYKLYSENDHGEGKQRAQQSLAKIGSRIVQLLESLESRIPAVAMSPEDFGYSPAGQGEFEKVDGFVDMMLERFASILTLLDGVKERWVMGGNPDSAGVIPKIESVRRKILTLHERRNTQKK